VTKTVEAHQDWSLRKRSAFDGNTTRRKRLVSVWNSEQRRRIHAGSQRFVHRREARRQRETGGFADVAELRQWLQNVVPKAVLPNYWAHCLLIQHKLLARRVAESGLTGAQWRPECPC
jgi:hypothetical protein